jgi:penicillin-binding protein 1A
MLRLFTISLNLGLLIAFGIIIAIIYMSDLLPSVDTLRDVQLQTPLRVYTIDGKLISQFGEKRRIPVEYEDVPQDLINAFIATEDRRFYEHSGVDLRGLARAVHHVATHGDRGQGGSTITMQLARNMFLSPQKTYIRKVNEILLAIQIENTFNKDQIMQLYLNKIYLGQRAYGVAAAAQVYYGKDLNELTLAQMAIIAGLPKAPSNINPITNPEAARERRKHVLDRMLQQDYITQEQHEEAVNAPITASYHVPEVEVRAPYLAEMVRQKLYEQLGEDAYTMGIKVYTTVHSKLQTAANDALENGLLSYDRRHGYRGVIDDINITEETTEDDLLKQLRAKRNAGVLRPGVVTSVNDKDVDVLVKGGEKITIAWNGLSWAKKDLGNLRYGHNPKYPAEILQKGNLIYVTQRLNGSWTLAQPPEVKGAFVAMRPLDGAILALTGGFDFYANNFNMATQAQRQPGSNFKPFIYSAALEHGFSAATLINDAPIVIEDASEEALWRPQNDNQRFLGPTRLRMGLARSRNLVSIRVLEAVGIKNTINYTKRFGFDDSTMPHGLSLALGTNLVTPLELARAYSAFANGGFLVEPYFIDHVTDDEDHIIEVALPRFACAPCNPQEVEQALGHELEAYHSAERIITEQNAYIMNSMLRDVVRLGTGSGARALERNDIGGKTGTTNEQKDGWFSGGNSDVIATTWIGFDDNLPLGEYAARSALPTWVDFMRVALDGSPESTLNQPPGIVSVRIDPKTGLLARGDQSDAIFEIFRLEEVPQERAPAALAQEEMRAPTDENASETLF